MAAQSLVEGSVGPPSATFSEYRGVNGGTHRATVGTFRDEEGEGGKSTGAGLVFRETLVALAAWIVNACSLRRDAA